MKSVEVGKKNDSRIERQREKESDIDRENE